MNAEQLREKAKDIIVAYVGVCLQEVTDRQLAEQASNDPEEIAELERVLSYATVHTTARWDLNEQGEYVHV